MKVLFRRQVYSNSSTGLEKSSQGVWNTPPSLIFGDHLALLMTSWEKKFLPSKKSFLKDGVNDRVTRGLRTGLARKSESIRITLSDLDPQQVSRRATGHFHPCFPVNRPVRRSVFSSNLSPDEPGPDV